MSTITHFRGDYYFLSNMYPVPIKYQGTIYQSVENFYQAMKIDPRSPNAKEERHKFANVSPFEAKVMGKRVILREDWELVKDDVMLLGITRKFNYPHLKQMLLDTAPHEIKHVNNHGDTYWGECPEGNGKDKLGRMLTHKRNMMAMFDD